MNKFTKCMTAIAVSALLAGPAAAFGLDATYAGTKHSIKFSGPGCGENINKLPGAVYVSNISYGTDFFATGPNTGYWDANITTFADLGFDWFGMGTFIVSKNGKTVLDAPKKATLGLSSSTFLNLVGVAATHALTCKNFVSFAEETCQQTKGDANMSKNGEQLKYKMDMECHYLNDKANLKKTKIKLNSGTLEFLGIGRP